MSTTQSHLPFSSQSCLRTLRNDGGRILFFWTLSMLLKYLASTLLLIVLFFPSTACAQGIGGPFADGERLQYKVRWSFIRLGTIEITQRSLDPGLNTRFLVRMTVESAQGLPFMNLHFIHEAVVATDPIRVIEETVIAGDDSTKRTSYRFLSDGTALVMTDSLNGARVKQDTIPAAARCYDAVSLLMYARCFGRTADTASLPTVNNYSIGMTRLNLGLTREMLSVSAFNDDVRSVYFTGSAEWVGSSFAGMSGGFCGWLSDDAASVPLRAEVKIFLGSVVLDLESYSRSQWNPEANLLVMQ